MTIVGANYDEVEIHAGSMRRAADDLASSARSAFRFGAST